jgi:cell division protein ZapE
VIEVDGGVDYRLRTLEQMQTFLVPHDVRAEAAMAAAFDAMRSGPDESTKLMIEGRMLTARRCAGSAVWFDFATLCDGPRSQRDYLELAQRFAVMFVSDIPVMTAAQGDLARRFTWLVDILYDHKVKLIASAAAPAQALYAAGPNAQEFPRTVSRLTEMRTHDYMALAHAADGAPASVFVPA